jgi:AraC-like DNA-binding protein
VLVERPSRLAGAVVWTRTSDGSPARIIPDACIDLMWYDDGLVVAGPNTAAFESRSASGALVAGIRFAPGMAPAILQVPAHALRDERVPLAELWAPAEVARLEERVAAADDLPGELEAVALDAALLAPTVDTIVAEVARRARADERVETIAAAVGLSPRQLQRRALDAFGYGPKLLARIFRLRRALDLARRGTGLAEVAARCGYADQAHLADDVSALTGTTMTGLGLARRQPPAGESIGAKRSTAFPSGSSTLA